MLRHIHIHIRIHVHVHVHIHIHVHIHTHIHINIHVHIHVHIHTHLYMHIHVHIYIHIDIQIDLHIDIHNTQWYLTYTYVSIDTGWRRLIGSPKLQIISHKRATTHRSLLRKMTYKDKGSYESSPPCNTPRLFPVHTYVHAHTHTHTHTCKSLPPCTKQTYNVHILGMSRTNTR